MSVSSVTRRSSRIQDLSTTVSTSSIVKEKITKSRRMNTAKKKKLYVKRTFIRFIHKQKKVIFKISFVLFADKLLSVYSLCFFNTVFDSLSLHIFVPPSLSFSVSLRSRYNEVEAGSTQLSRDVELLSRFREIKRKSSRPAYSWKEATTMLGGTKKKVHWRTYRPKTEFRGETFTRFGHDDVKRNLWTASNHRTLKRPFASDVTEAIPDCVSDIHGSNEHSAKRRVMFHMKHV